MAIISSHVLDSVVGDHGKGIRIACFRLWSGGRERVFDVIADEQGRIVQEVERGAAEAAFELVFYAGDYFAAQPAAPAGRQIMREVVVRFTIPSVDARIHIPLVLSPHSYTIWWSA